jgi:hypothetical protein
LDESLSEKLGGMSITTSSGGNQEPVTSLFGRMVDQAALAGVLNTLYDMHITLLSVEYINGE